MKDQISNCSSLTILNRDTLMADERFIDEAFMKEKCKISCFKRETCLNILKLLSQGKHKQAENLLIK